MNKIIGRFFGEHRFLSNFYPSVVSLDGHSYPTVEHAFQAAKFAPQDVRRTTIRVLATPGQAKRLCRRLGKPPDDWEKVKVRVMLDLLRKKFSEPHLASLLIGTGDALLVEGNTWGDTFWGAVDGKGKNMLGILLHIVRYQLKRGMLLKGEANG